jgi:F-type H+-transporting ATPase subunit delta
MTSTTVARRYARALYELAEEANAVADTGRDLAVLAEAVESSGGEVLGAGLLGHQQRQQLASAIAARLGADGLLGRFLGVLAEADRLGELPAIAVCFAQLEDEAAGRVRATVRTATELADADVASIKERFAKLAGRDVVPTIVVDSTLIGGVTVELEGRVFDGSVKTRLERLETRMAGE